MALTFDIGDSSRPLGHAIIYFRSGADVLATYALVLPIQMDMGKYLPPLLASQLGGMVNEAMGEGMSAFAAPPVPEAVESVAGLERLARLRGDDLVSGGNVALGDVAAAMHEAAEAVQEYTRLYHQYADTATPASEPIAVETQGTAEVQHVLYELMNERDRLAELSKLVGTMRFAVERGDGQLVTETDGALAALQRLLPDHYWVDRIRAAAGDPTDAGATLSQLYVERCYQLVAEDFDAVRATETQIADLRGPQPPANDIRS